jgi:hypothetical protein
MCQLLPAVGTKYTQLDAVRELGALLQASMLAPAMPTMPPARSRLT